MRRMKSCRGDDGTTAVIVACLTVALLGMGAVVIDISALHAERRELQNGADAAALALAADCGLAAVCGGDASSATAATYANANAEDSTSTVETIDWSVANHVTVATRTREPDGSGDVPFGLARIFGKTGQAVRAQATAAWGFPGGVAGTIPLTISYCEWDLFGATGTINTVVFHSGTGQQTPDTCNNQAGQDLPGGFGWLESDTCAATTDAGGWTDAETGDTVNKTGCEAEFLRSLIGTTVLIPVFDGIGSEQSDGTYVYDPDATGAGSGFHIMGYAGFILHGYQLQKGSQTWMFPGSSLPWPGDTPCASSQVCLAGEFTELLGPEDVTYTNLDGPDMGVVVVKMTG